MKRKIQKDNEGSTLVMLVVAFAFLAILGTIIMSVTMVNARIKVLEKDKKTSFYQCEVALDRIKVCLEDMVATSVRDSYQYILVNYTTYANEDAVKSEFYAKTLADVKKGFNPMGSVTGDDIKLKFEEFVSQSAAKEINGLNIGTSANFRLLDHSIVISNVVISSSHNEVHNTVSTDLRIRIPEIDVSKLGQVIDCSDLFYKDYSIIATKGIRYPSIPSAIGGTSSIIGNVFAGSEGIKVDGNLMKLNMFGDRIVIGGDLTANNQATIEIGSVKEKSMLWANNIITSNTVDSSDDTTIRIGGKSLQLGNRSKVLCCVQDDLSLGAKNSNVVIKGEYAGFTSSSDLNGSAITVNGANSYLDVSGISKLALAGYAHITDEMGNDILRLGESVGIKNNQMVYLVPSKYMKQNRNPIFLEEYTVSGDGSVNLAQVQAVYGAGTKIKNLHVQTVEGKALVYFYLDFEQESQTVEYLEKYISETGIEMWYKNGETAYQANEVKMCDPSNIYAAGNVVDYLRTGASYQQHHLTSKPFTNLEFWDGLKINDMQTYYTQLMHTLQLVKIDAMHPIPPVIDTSKTVFDTMIDADKIVAPLHKRVTTSYHVVDTADDMNTLYHVIITNGNYEVQEKMSGIIVAKGDVTVNQDFTGVIISDGMVYVQTGVTICHDATVLNDVFACGEDAINSYFYHVPSVPGGSGGGSDTQAGAGMIDMTKLITYENWKRR